MSSTIYTAVQIEEFVRANVRFSDIASAQERLRLTDHFIREFKKLPAWHQTIAIQNNFQYYIGSPEFSARHMRASGMHVNTPVAGIPAGAVYLEAPTARSVGFDAGLIAHEDGHRFDRRFGATHSSRGALPHPTQGAHVSESADFSRDFQQWLRRRLAQPHQTQLRVPGNEHIDVNRIHMGERYDLKEHLERTMRNNHGIGLADLNTLPPSTRERVMLSLQREAMAELNRKYTLMHSQSPLPEPQRTIAINQRLQTEFPEFYQHYQRGIQTRGEIMSGPRPTVPDRPRPLPTDPEPRGANPRHVRPGYVGVGPGIHVREDVMRGARTERPTVPATPTPSGNNGGIGRWFGRFIPGLSGYLHWTGSAKAEVQRAWREGNYNAVADELIALGVVTAGGRLAGVLVDATLQSSRELRELERAAALAAKAPKTEPPPRLPTPSGLRPR